MDPMLEAAARALAAFDPLGALKRIALRDDPEALALRGVAMAQLGDYEAARKLLGRAAGASASTDPLARARCLAALGEVALANRDLALAGRSLEVAAKELAARGDRANALFVELQRVRHLVLLGEVNDAKQALSALPLRKAPRLLRAIEALISSDIAVRLLDARTARSSIARARDHARAVGIASLLDEIEHAARDLDVPVARLVESNVERAVLLDEVEAVVRSRALVIDACSRTIRQRDEVLSLVTRPVLLALAVALGRAAPHEAPRAKLAEEAFGVRHISESMRVRLRVEVGRLRKAVARFGEIEAVGAGYGFRPRRATRIVVLLPPAPGEASALLALLRGGQPWSTSALASALGSSQRTVQRSLVALRDAGHIEGIGRGRAQRWVARAPEGFATTLLLLTRASTV